MRRLIELHDEYYRWHESSVNIHRRLWHPLYWSGLLIGAATAAVAAFASDAPFSSFGVVRVSLILLPILGAFVSTVTVQSQLSRRFQLRENGRRRVQDLWNEGRVRYAAVKTDAEWTAIHDDLARRLDGIEQEQGASFFAFVHPAAQPRQLGG